MRTALIGLALLGMSLAMSVSVIAAQRDTSIPGGVFTRDEAERGGTVFLTHCVACHSSTSAQGRAPSLMGDTFLLHWQSRTISELYLKVRDTMPKRGLVADNYPISDQDKVDVVAYLLRENGFPAGQIELRQLLEQQPEVRLDAGTGAELLVVGSIVEAMGCLEKRDAVWSLERSTEPHAASLEKDNGSIKRANGPTTSSIQLLNVFPDPASHVGELMTAKGFLVKSAQGFAINVVSFESVSRSCDP